MKQLMTIFAGRIKIVTRVATMAAVVGLLGSEVMGAQSGRQINGPINNQSGWEMGGTITNVFDPGNLMNVSVGDDWRLGYVFDLAAPDNNPGDPQIGEYGAGYVEFRIIGAPLNITNLGIRVENDLSGIDAYRVFGQGDVTPCTQLLIEFADWDGTEFSNDSLLTGGPLILENWEVSTMTFFDNALFSPQFTIQGFVSYLVPEPATLSLLALGGLLVTRRRR